MARPREYRKGKPGKWEYPHMPGTLIACCDCGLVHRYLYQITPDDFAVRTRDGKWRYGRRVRTKAWRDERATAQLRRQMANRGELIRVPSRSVIAFAFTAAKKRKRKRARRGGASGPP